MSWHHVFSSPSRDGALVAAIRLGRSLTSPTAGLPDRRSTDSMKAAPAAQWSHFKPRWVEEAEAELRRV